MTGLVAVVAALACYRLTMLAVADVLTQPIRDRIVDRYVHPAHELVWSPDPRRPFDENMPDDVKPLGYRFVAVCRCGERWVGDEWSDVASDANGHTNPRRGEMTEGPWWLDLFDCAWCASPWIAVPVVWSAWCFGDRAWWFVPASVLAVSAVTGIVSTYAKPQPKPRH